MTGVVVAVSLSDGRRLTDFPRDAGVDGEMGSPPVPTDGERVEVGLDDRREVTTVRRAPVPAAT